MTRLSLTRKFTVIGWFAAGSVLVAAGGRPVDIPERARGADRVVVATASASTPIMRSNAFGDRIVVSEITLSVEETLKGAFTGPIKMEVEGGTLNGVTMHVSSLPDVNLGDRAVFFLEKTPDGKNVPHLKGLGILKLDSTNRVRNSSLQLSDIRRMVLTAQ